ncbi:MAG TPA: 50S ribosomal protein L25 [Dehalococcoidia bacterium]|nr:50S ribosomal protein L25 [Dehalococcoidia bacterium]
MAAIELEAAPRTILGKQVKTLRRKGITPFNVYGHGIDSTPMQAETRALARVLGTAGKSTLVTVLTDGREPRTVLARDIQLDPRSHTILHVDFYQVKEFEKITVEVPIHFVGEINTSLQAGTLVHPLSAIVVECLPQDMPRAIEVDVSTLEAFNKPLHVRELNLPPNVTILIDQEQVVATIEPPRVVEVEEAVAAAPEAEVKKPEEEKGKEEKAKKEGA